MLNEIVLLNDSSNELVSSCYKIIGLRQSHSLGSDGPSMAQVHCAIYMGHQGRSVNSLHLVANKDNWYNWIIV